MKSWVKTSLLVISGLMLGVQIGGWKERRTPQTIDEEKEAQPARRSIKTQGGGLFTGDEREQHWKRQENERPYENERVNPISEARVLESLADVDLKQLEAIRDYTESLGLHAFPEVLSEAQETEDSELSGYILFCLMERWASLEPSAALAWVNQLESPDDIETIDDGDLRLDVLTAALRGGADGAEELVWAEMEKLMLGEYEINSVSPSETRLFATLAEVDEDRLWQLMIEHNESDVAFDGESALSGVMLHTLRTGNWAALKHRIAALEDEDDSAHVFAQMLPYYFSDRPEEAVRWVESLEGAEFQSVAEELVDRWSVTNPSETLQWLLHQQEVRPWEGMESTTVEMLAENDPDAASEWLRARDDQSERFDPARGQLAMGYGRAGRLDEAFEVLTSIADEEIRGMSLMNLNPGLAEQKRIKELCEQHGMSDLHFKMQSRLNNPVVLSHRGQIRTAADFINPLEGVSIPGIPDALPVVIDPSTGEINEE